MSETPTPTDSTPAQDTPQDATTIFPNDHTAYEFRLVDARKRLLGSYEEDSTARMQVDLVFTQLMDDEELAKLIKAKPDVVERARVIRDALDRLGTVEEQATDVAKGAKDIAGLCKAAALATRRRYKRLLEEATREEARREAEARKKRKDSKGPLFGDEPPVQDAAAQEKPAEAESEQAQPRGRKRGKKGKE